MKLDFIELGKLSVSKANMRHQKQAPDVSDILPTVRARGVLVPLIVRPATAPGDAGGAAADAFEIVAGSRRYHAARLVAEERGEPEPLPCAILEDGDDAAAIEASLIENMARLEPDEVTQWETFVRLVKEGRSAKDVAATFGLAEPAVRRVLALGNLLPRIRQLYRQDEIDAATVRHLTMASKSQQKAWLALFDDPDARAPIGHQLKAWLFGGQSISVAHALFDLAGYEGMIVSDLFGEERYFADAESFWTAQNAAVAARRAAYLDAGWREVVIVPPGEYFHIWEHEKAPKRKGGRVYIDVRASGEVVFHEGYVSRKEARRLERGEALDSKHKPARPELTSSLQNYIDLHRHAAVRAALVAHPAVALRLMVAHAVIGSPLWTVRVEPQAARSDAVRESVETCRGEGEFDAKRRAVLDLLGLSPEEPTVAGGNGDGYALAALFQKLLRLSDETVMDVVAVVMGETLAAGSAVIELLGLHIGVDMAAWWQADDAFFDLLRDREVLGQMLAELAGTAVANANTGEKAKTLKRIIRDHLDGVNGREKIEGWVPRWMAFPPSVYTARGGVGTVDTHERIAGLPVEREASADSSAQVDVAALEPDTQPLTAAIAA